MTAERHVAPTSVEQLVRDLDASLYDEQLPPQLEKRGEAALPKFADVQPFDVRAWAARKGVKLTDQS